MKKIKVYGERNTNTNYLEKLLLLNLQVTLLRGVVPKALHVLQSISPEHEFFRNRYFELFGNKNGGWKHSFPKLPLDIDQLTIVTLTKNPYSWLLSLYKKPYHHPRAFKFKSFQEFLTSPWPTIARENYNGGVIENPIQLWNIKNRAYRMINSSAQVLNLTSENLLLNPEDSLCSITDCLGLKFNRGDFVNFESAAKTDADKNNKYYRNYYLNEKWKELLSQENVDTINSYLDTEILDLFGYEQLKTIGAAGH